MLITFKVFLQYTQSIVCDGSDLFLRNGEILGAKNVVWYFFEITCSNTENLIIFYLKSIFIECLAYYGN